MNKKKKYLQCTIVVAVVFIVLTIALISVIYCKKKRKQLPLNQAIERTCLDKNYIDETVNATVDKEQLSEQLISQLEDSGVIPQQQLRKLDKDLLKQDLLQQIDKLQQYDLLPTESSKDTLPLESKAHLANALTNAVTNQIGNPKIPQNSTTVSDVVDMSALDKDMKELKDTGIKISYRDYGQNSTTNNPTSKSQNQTANQPAKNSSEQTKALSSNAAEVLSLRIEALETMVNSIKNTPINAVSTEELKALQSQFEAKATNLQSQIHSLNNEINKGNGSGQTASDSLKSIQSQISSLTADIKQSEDATTSIRKELSDTTKSIKQQLDEKQSAINSMSLSIQKMESKLRETGQMDQDRSEISSEFEEKLLKLNKSVASQMDELRTTIDDSLDRYDKSNEEWINDASIKISTIQDELAQAVKQTTAQTNQIQQQLNNYNESCIWIVDVNLDVNRWTTDATGRYVYQYSHPSIQQSYSNIYIDYNNPDDACGIFYEQKNGYLLFLREEKPDMDIQINSIKIEQPQTEEINEKKNS